MHKGDVAKSEGKKLKDTLAMYTAGRPNLKDGGKGVVVEKR